jgi:hypothetical protein
MDPELRVRLDRFARAKRLSAAAAAREIIAGTVESDQIGPRTKHKRLARVDPELLSALSQVGRSVGLIKVAHAMRTQQQLPGTELAEIAEELAGHLSVIRRSIVGADDAD